MLVSKNWLQKYVDAPLPDAAALCDALTFHAFEIDGVEEKDGDAAIDVKVLPNRAADCLSHRGIARELGAILDLPLKPDPLRGLLPPFPATDELSVSVEDARACPRYMGAVMRGVKVGPSPEWLRKALEAVGQRSINTVVDATNYVMLDLGQPMHAFDAALLTSKPMNGLAGRSWALGVREAREGERITTLSGDELELPKGTLVITDAHADTAIGIAGIKGGKAAGISEATTDIILEAANFDAAMVRRAMQGLKLYTDAGKRFQNNVSPELAAYALRAAADLIRDIAGGELAGAVDSYPAPQTGVQVPVDAARVNAVLGSSYQGGDLARAFDRLGLAYKRAGDEFTVDAPFERRDLQVAEDLAEEVGRIMGYEGLASAELPPSAAPADQRRFRGIERMKDQLVEQGYTEVSTQAFATEGDVKLANPLDVERPYLRTTLEQNLAESLERAKRAAPRYLGPNVAPKLFELGTVFPKDGEFMELRMTERVAAWGDAAGTSDNVSIAKMEEYGADYEPEAAALGAYQAASAYPFVLRDIALWTPAGTAGESVAALIRAEAGPLLARADQFDRFEKGGRVSFAFRLVFEAMDRTLSDADVNPAMEKVAAALARAGYEIR
jgi:phenylalanyl-tRNA synthetase beta chain